MDNKKEQERSELFRTIWNIADDLRGSVTGWDFKQYVLGMLFYRFISENLSQFINKRQGDDFDYANFRDDEAEKQRDFLVSKKGFFMKPSQLFENVCKNAAENIDLNQTLANVFSEIEKSASNTDSADAIKGLFANINVSSNMLGATLKERNEKLLKLINAIASFKLGAYDDNTIDVFGDAYEYLMAMYAANAGKSGGEFFTPQEVSELLARIVLIGKTEVNKVYDPACGSGSLLLKFAKILGKDKVRYGFYGQEKNITTYNLCRINMFLHDINFSKFHIAYGDTLINPTYWDNKPFEAIVSNPPYSTKWDGKKNPLLINDARFAPAGTLAPEENSDMAFIMHSLSLLAPDGVAAIVCFPGIMFRLHAEQKIRKYLVDNNFIDAVIELPSDLFFGPTIFTDILVMKKNKSDNKVLFIDASAEFIRADAKNKLTDKNIEKILNCFEKRKSAKHFCRLVSYDEIKNTDYNLSVSSYIDKKDAREVIDIKDLNSDISKIVSKIDDLRAKINGIIGAIHN